MSSLPHFPILAAHKIVGFPDGNIISWCPQMDLLAVSMNQTSIWVFRLDGERIYSINNRAKILHLQWSHSGKFFVLSGTDHQIKVYDSNNGKLVNQFSTSAELPITLVSWASIDIPKSIAPDGNGNVYQDLFKVEILSKMPKLAHEIDNSDAAGILSADTNAPYTSASVTNTTENESTMDYLLVASGDSSVSVTFNNLFTVSGIELPSSEFKLLRHTVGCDFFQQSFLVRDATNKLHLQDFKIDITGPRRRGHFFDTIRWVSQVISIINHIHDQFCILQMEAKEFLALYDRYLSNYKDALYSDVDTMTEFPSPDDVEDRIVDDLGAMLLTGLIPSSNKDYWLNQFGERGMMRLSSVGNNVYDNVRKILFTQLILGSEKLIILLSYLESLTKTADVMKEENYGISLECVQTSITLIKSLVKKIYDLIWRLNDEHEYFNQFLNWAQVEILEKLAKEDTDPESFFAEHPAMDFRASSIMEYFNDYMFDSVLMREFDFECAHETLVKRDSDNVSLKTHISQLQDQLKSSLSGMEAFVASKVVFSPSVPLDMLCEGNQIDIELFESGKIVTSVNGPTMSIAANALKLDVSFPGEIICHKLVGETHVLVLYATDGNRQLDLVEFPQKSGSLRSSDLIVLQSLSFGPHTAVKKPAYMTINSIEKKTEIKALILDESKKDYIILRI